MPKHPTSVHSKITELLQLKKVKYKVYESLGSGGVHCQACNKTVNVRAGHEAECLDQHQATQSHMKMEKKGTLFPTIRQSFAGVAGAAKTLDTFNMDLTRAFIEAGIPLQKASHESVKSFLEKQTGKQVYSRVTLQKNYVPVLYNEKIERMRDYVGDSDVFFILDETPDRMGRSVVNVLVGRLNGEESQVHLLSTEFMNESVDNVIIGRMFLNACVKLWPDGVEYDRVLLVVTDGASYMKTCFRVQKEAGFSSLHHVTCLAHGIHNVCELARYEYDVVNQFIARVKRALSYAASERKRFKEIVGKHPPEPVITRWGTWLKAANFYYDNLDKVREFVEGMTSNAAGVKNLKLLARNALLESELHSLVSFFPLIGVIALLEKRNAKARDQLNLIEELKCHDLPSFAKEKIEQIISDNPDLLKLMSEDQPFEWKCKIRFAPLVSVDVERSFSIYKYILSDRRTNMSEASLEMYNALAFNTVSIADELIA